MKRSNREYIYERRQSRRQTCASPSKLRFGSCLRGFRVLLECDMRLPGADAVCNSSVQDQRIGLQEARRYLRQACDMMLLEAMCCLGSVQYQDIGLKEASRVLSTLDL